MTQKEITEKRNRVLAMLRELTEQVGELWEDGYETESDMVNEVCERLSAESKRLRQIAKQVSN